MITLGLNPFSHDASAAIIKDGKVLAAVAQERFDRMKHSKNIPKDAIRYCLQVANITNTNEITEIGINFNYFHWKGTFIACDYGLDILLPIFIKQKMLRDNGHLFNIYKAWHHIRKELNYKGNVTFFAHHDCHAASSYFSSPFQNAAVVTTDGRGEKNHCSDI
jgi:carbamoyltransferase